MATSLGSPLASLWYWPHLPVEKHRAPQLIIGLTKAEAEEWLDWLENHGHPNCGLAGVGESSFAVWFH